MALPWVRVRVRVRVRVWLGLAGLPGLGRAGWFGLAWLGFALDLGLDRGLDPGQGLGLSVT